MYDKATTTRFWEKVDIRGPDECWPWKGLLAPKGYGRFTLSRSHRGNRHRRASAVAWELTNHKSIGGRLACHTCDNPPCCNPAHIYAGTSQDNANDMKARGRWRGPENVAGDANGNAKLGEAEVLLTKRYINQGHSNCHIASLFGVCHQNISMIRRGKTWTHLILVEFTHAPVAQLDERRFSSSDDAGSSPARGANL